MATTRLCSIPNCGKLLWSKGYCGAHYMRMRNHGDPLAGGTSNGEPLRFIREVAMHHTSRECLLWPFAKNNKGYGTVLIDGKRTVASRYVCESAHGAPPTPEHEASHSCGNGHIGCVSPVHLLWKTSAENTADRLIHGTHNRGERNALSKLTEDDVHEIRAMKGISSQRELAARFGVAHQTVADIQHRRKWAWL